MGRHQRRSGVEENAAHDIDHRLSPAEVRDRLPFDPVLTSEGLGWPGGLTCERFLGLNPMGVAVAPESHHRLVLLSTRDEAVSVHSSWEGVESDVALSPKDPQPLMCVVPAGRSHEWEWRGGRLDSRVILLGEDLVEQVAGEAGLKPCDPTERLRDVHEVRDSRLAAKALPLFRQLESARQAVRQADGITTDPMAAELIAGAVVAQLLCGQEPKQRIRRAPCGRLTQRELLALRTFVAGRIEKKVNITQLAAVVGRSASHFRRVFRVTTGECPKRFVIRVRVRAAAGMLRQGVAPPDAAVRCGFTDQSHLGRRTKEVLGMTPGELMTRT